MMHAILAGALSPPSVMVVDHIEAPAMTDESAAVLLKEAVALRQAREESLFRGLSRTLCITAGCSASTEYVDHEAFKKPKLPYARPRKNRPWER